MEFTREALPLASLKSNTSHSKALCVTFGLLHQNVDGMPSCSLSGPLTAISVSTLLPNGSENTAGAKSSASITS